MEDTHLEVMEVMEDTRLEVMENTRLEVMEVMEDTRLEVMEDTRLEVMEVMEDTHLEETSSVCCAVRRNISAWEMKRICTHFVSRSAQGKTQNVPVIVALDPIPILPTPIPILPTTIPILPTPIPILPTLMLPNPIPILPNLIPILPNPIPILFLRINLATKWEAEDSCGSKLFTVKSSIKTLFKIKLP